MSNYLFVFRGKLQPGSPATREDTWNSWFGELGAAVIEWGHRVRGSRTVRAGGATEESTEPVTGFVVVSAGSLDHAVNLARGCPILLAGGAVEVGETSD